MSMKRANDLSATHPNFGVLPDLDVDSDDEGIVRKTLSDSNLQAFTDAEGEDSHSLPKPSPKARLKTCNTIGTTRRRTKQDWLIGPEALRKLHLKNEERRRLADPSKFPETSMATLEAAFSNGRSWLMYGKLPDRDYEREYAKRPIGFWGTGRCLEGVLPGREPQYMLKHWGAAMLNTKGLKSDQNGTPVSSIIGQDNCSVATLADGWEVFCVMDGHGKGGHWVSTRAVKTMPFFLQDRSSAQMLNAGGFEAALTSAFIKVEEDLEMWAFAEQIEIENCGSTATVAIRDKGNDDLWVATVGDSRAVLIVPGEGVVYSTKDHKPSVESEAQRLEEKGSYIERTVYEGGEVDERVFVKGEEYPGLNMTRSLGDVCVKEHGVIATPEVVRWPTKKWKTAYYLACSDGVWEFLPTDEVADIVLKQLDAGKTCSEIVENLLALAKERWLEFDDEYVDDITLLLVPLNDGIRPSRGLMTHAQLAGECFAGCKKDCSLM